jgi:hypothetical protein
MTEQSPPWPKQGPPSYFPSIEQKYGRSIAQWQQVIASCGLDKHMAIVVYLKSEHGMGHGHARYARRRWPWSDSTPTTRAERPRQAARMPGA